MNRQGSSHCLESGHPVIFVAKSLINLKIFLSVFDLVFCFTFINLLNSDAIMAVDARA